MRFRIRRPSPAMVVALIALMVAMGGTATAARLITSAQIKNNTVSSADVKNNSLLKKDFKAGQLPAGAQGPQGPKGETGSTGATGATGPRGPSAVYHAESSSYIAGNRTVSKALPAGRYAVNGKAVFFDFDGDGSGQDTGQSCNLSAPGGSDSGFVSYGPADVQTAAVQEVFNLPAGGTITMTCTVDDPAGDSIGDAELSAIEVETIN